MAETYDIGDYIRIQTTFKVNSTVTDPDAVTLKIKDPSGNTDTYTYALSQVTKASTGVYYKDVTPDEAGSWWFEWTGTGACVAVEESYFYVRKSRV